MSEVPGHSKAIQSDEAIATHAGGRREEMTKKTIRREYPKTIMTRYGPGSLIGYDDKNQACVSFLPGDAPELEAKYWRGGPSYTCFISTEDVIIEKES